MRSLILAGVLAVSALTGCASSERDNRILTGAVVGGALGAAVGDTAGAVGGAIVGGAIGAATSDRDNDRRSAYQRCRDRGYTHRQCR